jgi:hypothetical protein
MLQHDIILRSPSKATRAPIFLVFSLSLTETSISETHYPSSYYCFCNLVPLALAKESGKRGRRSLMF